MRRVYLSVWLLGFCMIADAAGIAQANAAGASPSLTGFSPVQGAQGTTVNMTLTGTGFAGGPLLLHFTPSQGLSVGNVHAVSATQISAQVQIDSSAKTGARLVVLAVGNRPLRSNVPFMVTASTPCGKPGTPPCSDAGKTTEPPARQVRPPDPMQILRLVPNQLPAGSEGVELTLEGKNFVPGTLVNFGGLAGGAPDVLVVGVPRYVNSTEMRVTVNVLPLALPGGRDVQLRTPKQESVIGKGMLNVEEPPPEKPPAPSPSPSPK